MGWLRRLNTVIRTQVNDWVRGIEDPEERLDRAIVDLQMALVQLRQSVAQAIATQKRTERQRSQHQTWAVEWYNRANLALIKGEEAIAREALSQRQSYLALMAKMDHYLGQQRQVVEQLKGNMRTLDQQIAEARTRRDLYKARARSAEASQRLHTLIAEMGDRSTDSIFGPMEERVLDLEAQAAALEELNRLQPAATLALQDSVSADSSVEAELLALKTHLGLGNHPLAPGPSSAPNPIQPP
ncbi:MAG: PspA/IM30 family protein [Cyanobacteria bacterium]|nr:PspA/IM30 family protein [Cyanobacteriota bacterium]MDA0864894.1 PspA/IM30 family protein [Cyanobacteriota bacterium]